MLRPDRYPCCVLLLAGTLNLLRECPPVAVNPSLELSQYAHTARTVRDGFSLGNTRDNVPIRLPLIDGKDIRFSHLSTEQGLPCTKLAKQRPARSKASDLLAVVGVDGVVESVCGRRFLPVAASSCELAACIQSKWANATHDDSLIDREWIYS